MERKKYELLKDGSIEVKSHTLYRIRALKDFGNIMRGALGGCIEKEDNLSHEGNCWVRDDAKVYGDAYVSGNVQILDHACISGDAWIYGDARIINNACVFDHAWIYDNAHIFGNVWISDKTRISNDADISFDLDFCTITVLGSDTKIATFFKCKDGIIKVNCDHFNGTIDEFRDEVKKIYENNKYLDLEQYLLLINLVETQLKKENPAYKEDK